MNDKYTKLYLKYKNKYDKLHKKFLKQNGGKNDDIKYVAIYLIHINEDNIKQLLLLKRNKDNKWMTPAGHIENEDYINTKNNNDAHINALKREFLEETGFELPKLENIREFIFNKKTKIYIANIDHLDMSLFKRNNETHSIGLFNIDMLKNHNYEINSIPIVSYVKESMRYIESKNLF